MDEVNEKLLLEIVKEKGVVTIIEDYKQEIEEYEYNVQAIRKIYDNEYDNSYAYCNERENLSFDLYEFSRYYLENNFNNRIVVEMFFEDNQNQDMTIIVYFNDLKNLKQLESIDILDIRKEYTVCWGDIILNCITLLSLEEIGEIFRNNESLTVPLMRTLIN